LACGLQGGRRNRPGRRRLAIGRSAANRPFSDVAAPWNDKVTGIEPIFPPRPGGERLRPSLILDFAQLFHKEDISKMD
jgi:hypothetical protein